MSPALTTTTASTASTSQPQAPVKGVSKSAHPHAATQPRPSTNKTTRTRARARGRARRGGLDSDDEIERERQSDDSASESPGDSDDDDDSEAETQSEVESVRSHPDTPSTTQSPPPGEVEAAQAAAGFEEDGGAGKPGLGPEPEPEPSARVPAFLEPSKEWSEMMMEVGDGDGSLPVIEFAELHVHAAEEIDGDGPVTGEEKNLKAPEEATADTDKQQQQQQDGADSASKQDTAGPGPRPSRGHAPHPPFRGRGSAHEHYQKRLRDDVTFVPKVGEFWGHDDRLLEKELRSLSPWWRNDRWNRGRRGFAGRGAATMRGRGRGRGGYFQGAGNAGAADGAEGVNGDAVEGEANGAQEPEPELPPVERQWQHDGFLEMKARDEQRRVQERQDAGSGSGSGSRTPFRGGFVPRGGRGGFADRPRGAFSPTSGRGRGRGMPFTMHIRSHSEHVWFAMKPERIWTKQFEGFLYFEPALKAKPGRGAGFRVHLPGKGADIIRSPISVTQRERASAATTANEKAPSEAATSTSGSASRVPIIKIPKPLAQAVVVQEVVPESFTTVEQLPVDITRASVKTVREEVVHVNGTAAPMEQVKVKVVRPKASTQPPSPQEPAHNDNLHATPGLTRDDSLSDNSIDIIDVAEQPAPVVVDDQKDDQLNGVPPIPPVYSPSQPSPTYATPYAYPPNIHPGMAVPQPGVAYQMAGAHPMFIHATPPPTMQVYQPHPHSMPFVPGHMHHHSMSVDYIHVPSAGTPPLNGFIDPTTGQPLFSLPRQSSRIEIRAPGEGAGAMSDGAGAGASAKRPSNLRNSSVPDASKEDVSGSSMPMHPVNGVAQPIRYTGAPEFYPRSVSYDGRQMGHAYQPSEGSVSVASGHEDRGGGGGGGGAYQMQDPAMMGYAGYPQQYYYPEQYYAAYPQVPQQPGHYDPYAASSDPPIYY